MRLCMVTGAVLPCVKRTASRVSAPQETALIDPDELKHYRPI